MSSEVVGGGTKKILYALRTATAMGVRNSAKALTSKNTCKACALGMGGQAGGMTDEMGDFPAVCNKSIQAQSTDIQPPITHVVLEHPLEDLMELDAHDLEHLGRLGTPLHKAAGDDRYRVVDWEYDRIRDFLILHYHATSRTDSAFWDHVRTMTVPDSLREKIELFRIAGRLARYTRGLFLEPSWLAVLIGQGIVPEGWDQRADAIGEAPLGTALDRLRGQIAAAVERLPDHGAYLHGPAPGRAA